LCQVVQAPCIIFFFAIIIIIIIIIIIAQQQANCAARWWALNPNLMILPKLGFVLLVPPFKIKKMYVKKLPESVWKSENRFMFDIPVAYSSICI
jgi:hypothetical protein